MSGGGAVRIKIVSAQPNKSAENEAKAKAAKRWFRMDFLRNIVPPLKKRI